MPASGKNDKILVILGPTASGKTGLGIRLAKQFSGEIVSADSRQVYRGMDIGTGKDLNDYQAHGKNHKAESAIRVPYHLIDVASPKTGFNLANFHLLALQAVRDILRRGKLPIIVGGSGLYLQALVDGYDLPQAKPDFRLRNELEKMSADQLYDKLKKTSLKKARLLNDSERKNKRRLIRRIEILSQEPPAGNTRPDEKPDYQYLVLGLKRSKEDLSRLIRDRLISRLEKEGMLQEAERLHAEGVSWESLESFGLEYKYMALYLQNKISRERMEEQLFRAIIKFSNRQMTWFRRWEKQGRKIFWIKDGREARGMVKKFLAVKKPA